MKAFGMTLCVWNDRLYASAYIVRCGVYPPMDLHGKTLVFASRLGGFFIGWYLQLGIDYYLLPAPILKRI